MRNNTLCLLVAALMSLLFFNSCIGPEATEEPPKKKEATGLDTSAMLSSNTKSKADLVSIDAKIKNDIISKGSKNINMVRNGNFSEGKQFWRLHKCELKNIDGQRQVAFDSPNKEFKKLFQIISYPAKAGTKVTLSADVATDKFSDTVHYPGKPVWTRPRMHLFFLAEDKKTRLYAEGEKGKGFFIESTNGKYENKSITYTVPKGTEAIEVAFICGPPVKAFVKSISSSISMTKNEALALGLNWPKDKTTGIGKLKAEKKAQKWATDNEIIPTVHPITISVDGKDDDWTSVPFAGKINKAVPKFTVPSSPEDCEGSFKVAVNDNFLYLLIKIQDDKLVFGKNKNYNDDSIEICVSPQFNQGGKHYGEMDFQISLTPKGINSEEFYISGMNYQKYFMPTIKRLPVKNGWGVEIAIPLKNELFVAPVYDMKAIGLNVAYNDNDSETREHKLSWSKFETQDTGWRDTGVLGALLVLSDTNKDAAFVEPSESFKLLKGEKYDFANNAPGKFNIIKNSSFEEDDVNWMEWYGRCGYKFSIDEENSKAGSKSMKIDGTAFKSEAPCLLTSQYFDVIPGEKYQFEAEIKTDSPEKVNMTVRTKAPNYKLTQIVGKSISKSDGWQKVKCSFIVDSVATRENNVLDLLISFYKLAGYNAWVDNVSLKRFTPSSFDAEFEFPSHNQVFLRDSKTSVKLNLQSSQNEELNIKTDFIDAFSGKPISSLTDKIKLEKDKIETLSIPLPTEKCGYIRVTSKITDAKKDFVVRQSNYAVREKLTGNTGLADMCIAHHIYFNDSAEKVVKAAKEIGTSSIRVFIDRFQEYDDNKFNFDNLEPLVDAANRNDVKFIGCVKTFDREMKRPAWDIDVFERYLRQLVRKFKGKVDVWEIGNEPNLTMGWPPKPDAREYETLLRCAYNAVKEEDPQAKVATAGFNQAKLDHYFKTFLDMDKGNFYDIFAFHPYDYLKVSAFNESFPEFMKAVKENHPVGEAIDTESGFDHETYQWAVELSTKKIPFFLFCGVDEHYEWGFDKSASGYLYAPYASSSPQQAAYTLLNNLYDNAEPLGELNIDDFTGYINKGTQGTFLVLWRSGYDKSKSVKLPVAGAYKVLDVFGNDITKSFPAENGKVNIKLKNRLPIYLFGVNTDSLQDKITAPPKYEIGKNHVPYVKNVLILPEKLKGFFDIRVPKGVVSRKNMKVKNYSDKTVKVTLKTSSPIAEFEPQTITIGPKETKKVKLLIQCDKPGKFNVSLEGQVGEEQLAPLPVNIEVSDALTLSTKGCFAVMSNSSELEINGQLSFKSPLYDILPFVIKNLKIKASGKLEKPISILPRRNKHGYTVYPKDGIAEIFAQFAEDGGKDTKTTLEFSLAKAISAKVCDFSNPKLFEKLQSSQKSLLELKSDKNGENSKLNAFFAYDMNNIYVIAKVEDSSQNQTNSGGYIGEGDSLIIGIDAKNDSKGNEYQVDDFEAGFALRNDKSTVAYIWDGKYGLESTDPFKNADLKIRRDGKTVYYTLKIPVSAKLAKNKSIGFSLKLVNLTKSGKKTVLRFGAGLDKPRDASAFGILNLK